MVIEPNVIMNRKINVFSDSNLRKRKKTKTTKIKKNNSKLYERFRCNLIQSSTKKDSTKRIHGSGTRFR